MSGCAIKSKVDPSTSFQASIASINLFHVALPGGKEIVLIDITAQPGHSSLQVIGSAPSSQVRYSYAFASFKDRFAHTKTALINNATIDFQSILFLMINSPFQISCWFAALANP